MFPSFRHNLPSCRRRQTVSSSRHMNSPAFVVLHCVSRMLYQIKQHSSAPAAAQQSKATDASVKEEGQGESNGDVLSLEQPSILYVPGVKERPVATHDISPLPLMLSPSLTSHPMWVIGLCVGERLMMIGWETERNLAFACISAPQEKD